MAYCGPACAVPSCASTPVVGFGSAGAGYGGLGGLGYGYGSGLGYGYGSGLGYGYGSGLGYGYGSGALVGSSVPSANLGVLSGVNPSCINQIPASEVTIQPPASIVTIPGPILSASCEPVSVGGNTPCAVGGYGGRYSGAGLLGSSGGLLGSSGGLLGYSGGVLGSSLWGGLGARRYGRRGSICYSPC